MRPETIKILYRDFRILDFPDGDSDARVKAGEVDLVGGVISISQYADDAFARNALWHEISHALWDMMGLEAKGGEEKIVDVLTNGQMTVIRDNPALMSYLAAT